MPEKKEISWNELVKEMKEKKKDLHLSEVLKLAGKEWKKVKEGVHEQYVAGKNKILPKKKKSKKMKPEKSSEDAEDVDSNKESDKESSDADSTSSDKILPGHKGAPSITRPGKIDYRTHKGDKYYHRGNKLEDENIDGVKGKPYSHHKTKKNRKTKKKKGRKHHKTRKTTCKTCKKNEKIIKDLRNVIKDLQNKS